MAKFLYLIVCLLLAANTLAQERLFTDKERGGIDNGVFGKVDDELNVTPTGQLSYEIPIPAIPGTGGVKPNLSISYSSSTKVGLAGYGFDLTGLSVISRIPSDLFHDGISTAVDFTNHDHFALDGQRLMNYSAPTSIETEYRTESNSFARIMAKGNSINPESFKVYTKSGLIYDYVSVAKALGKADSDSTIFWLVSRISDTSGNYMTVTYGGDAATNDFYPLHIDYTGNSTGGLSPYASICFGYQDNPYSPTTYVCGVSVRKSKIISTISLCVGAQNVRTFRLDYQVTNRKYQLGKITESASEGTYKNSTRFIWNNIASFKVDNYDYSKSHLIHKAVLTVGDFNGDGLADFIATPENGKAGWKGWKLFASHGNGFSLSASGMWYWNDDDVEQVVCGDFNGDGYADMVVKRQHSGKWHNCDLYTTSVDSDGNVAINYSNPLAELI